MFSLNLALIDSHHTSMKYSTNESTGLLKNQGFWKNTDIGLEPMFRNFPSELPPPHPIHKHEKLKNLILCRTDMFFEDTSFWSPETIKMKQIVSR